MKKLILPLLLVVSFIFIGLNKAKAAVTFTPASTVGMAPATLPAAPTLGLVISGTTIKNSGAASISFRYIDWSATVAPSTYFTNFQLWVNTTGNTFAGATQLTPAGTFMTSATDSYFTITQTVPAATSYTYFLVADYTIPPATTTAWTINNIDFETAGFTLYTSGLPNSYTYNMTATPTVTATNVTAGLSPAAGSNIYQGQSGLAVDETSFKASTATTPITQLVYTVTPSLATANNYFANPPVLYSSTSATFTGAPAPTPVAGAVATLNTVANTITFNITGTTVSTATTYYYLVLNYSVTGGSVSQTFTFRLSSYTTGYSGAVTTTVAAFPANSYTCAPPVTVSTASTTGLATTPIAGSQTGIGIFGFTATSYPATTFTSFTFTSTVADMSQYFSGVTLYRSTTNSFAAATAVTGGYTVSSLVGQSGFTINAFGTAQNVTNSSYYYFIVVNYTAPAANVSFQLNLTGFSATTGGVNTNYLAANNVGLNVLGMAYTLSPAAPLVYYWTGNGATSDWKLKTNWQTSTTAGTYTNTGTYPGANPADVANFNYNYFANWINNFDPEAYPTINAYNITLNTVNILDGSFLGAVTYLTVNSNYLLTTTTLNVDATGTTGNNGTELSVAGTSATATTPILTATGVTTIGYDGELYLPGPGIINFPSGSSVTLTGNANNIAEIYSQGGSITSTSSTFSLSGAGSGIEFDNGSFTNTTSTFTLSGKGSEVISDGGNINFNSSSIVNVTGAVAGSGALCGLVVANDNGAAAMSFNSSTANLGTTAANGAAAEIYVVGNTFNANSSTINLNGAGSLIYNDEQNIGQYSIVNINASTINLGTTAISGSGAAAEIYNNAEANFNLNAGSIINMNGANSEILNTSYAPAGTTYYGVFTCASTSVINPISTTAIINNNIAASVANAGSYFTLLSDINGSATIGTLGTGAKISGVFNVQRYISGGSYYLRNYRLLSSPVNKTAATSNATNLLDLSYLGASATIPYSSPVITYHGAFIAGPGTTFGTGIHSITNPLMYLYQENIVPGTAYNAQFTSGKNVGIISLNSTAYSVGTASTAAGAGTGSPTTSPSVPSTAISLPGYDNNAAGTVAVPPGNGYLLYYIDNNARTAAASAQLVPNSSNVTASGYINQGQVQLYMWGSVSQNLTDTYGLAGVRLPGITVVGNPYPSTIDLKKVWTDNSSTILPSLYQLDITTEQFDTYNASTGVSSGALSSEYIATGQGFYIHVDSLGSTKSFAFKEDQKTASATAPFFPPISNFSVIHPVKETVDNLYIQANPRLESVNSLQSKIVNSSIVRIKQAQKVATADNYKTLTLVTNTNLNGSNKKIVKPNIPKGSTFMAPIIVNPVIVPDNVTPEVPLPTPPTPKQAVTNPAGLHLKLVVDSVDNDEVGVFFNKAWVDTFDSNDSRDLDGLSGKVYLSSYTSDDVRTSINALGDYKPGKRVKLYVKSSTAGIFQLQMSDIQNFDTKNYSVFLLDKMLSDSLDLTLYKSYNFNYAPGTANDSTRFVLAIEHKPVPYYALLSFAGQKVTPGVQLNWQTKNQGNQTTFVLQKLSAGNVYVAIDSLQSDSSGEFSYVDQHPVLGNNTYRLQQTNELGVITYSAPVTIGYNSTSPNGGLTLYPNPAKTTMTVTLATSSTATTVATADIYNTSGKLIEHKVVNSNSFIQDVSAYDLGAYIIELKNSNGFLVGKSKFVKVN